jgi:hypothetical protein
VHTHNNGKHVEARRSCIKDFQASANAGGQFEAVALDGLKAVQLDWQCSQQTVCSVQNGISVLEERRAGRHRIDELQGDDSLCPGAHVYPLDGV